MVEEPVKERRCRGCSTTFTPTNDARLYCSPACKIRAKRQRERARRPPPQKLPTIPCVDCGAAMERLPGSGRPPLRCPGCRAHRISSRALERRRQEYAARVTTTTSEPPTWRSRLLDLITNRKG